MDLLDAQATPISVLVYSGLGLAWLTFIYGFYGLFITFCRFLRLGSKRFFKQVDRPAVPSKAKDPIYGTHEMIKLKSSNVSLHYVSRGLPNQPMILFLHGFPECWYSWRNQMKYFSKDYRVVALDQRGYGLSTKAPFVGDHKIEILASDVADVIELLGYESCILVGHDIGGLVAWTTAMLYPHLVEKLIIMNSPHPVAFRQELSFKQLRKLWNLFFYQLPYVSDYYFQSDDFAIFQRLFHKKPDGLVNKDLLTDNDIEVYKYTFSQKGTTKSALNYYRALLRYPADFSRAEILAPVLLLWGCQDRMFSEELADASQKYCSDIRVKKIPNASHWVNQDVPEIVNKYIDIFLKENPPMEHNYDF